MTASAAIFSIVACLVLAIIVECIGGFLLGAKDVRDIAVIAAAQLLTEPIVEGVGAIVVPMALTSTGMDMALAAIISWIVVIALSALAIFVEGKFYENMDVFESPYRASLILNASSFLVGLALQMTGVL